MWMLERQEIEEGCIYIAPALKSPHHCFTANSKLFLPLPGSIIAN
jgi:hypothetical protein